VTDVAVGEPRLSGTDARDEEHVVTDPEVLRMTWRQRRQACPRDADETEARAEVVLENLPRVLLLIEQRDRHFARAEDDVVDGEDEPVGIDDGSRAHALVPEQPRRWMLG